METSIKSEKKPRKDKKATKVPKATKSAKDVTLLEEQDGSNKNSKDSGKLRVRVVKHESPFKAADTPKFRREAKDVDEALKRSFGKIISETSARYKASFSLMRTVSHWQDGDSKKLVVALAHRYQKPHLLNGHVSPPQKKLVANAKNSRCSSARLKDLDWDRGWWTDDSFGMHYLHVHHKDGETIHRVYCLHSERPRIEMIKGKLYWLYQSD